MAKAIELLVHAGAPSNVMDDERYKAQAEAYLGFQGIALELVSAGSQSFGRGSRQEDNPAPNTNVSIPPSGEAGPCSTHNLHVGITAAANYLHTDCLLDDTQLALTVLESQIISSNFRVEPTGPRPPPSNVTKGTSLTGNLEEPRPVIRAIETSVIRNDAASLHSVPHEEQCPSQVQSPLDSGTPSSYLKSPELDRPTKRTRTGDRVLQLDQTIRQSRPFVPIQEGSGLALGYVGNGAVDPTNADVMEVEPLLHDNQDMSVDNVTTSELPTTYSLSNITTDSSRGKTHSMQRSVSDPGPVIISISDDTPVSDPNHRENEAYQVHELRGPFTTAKEAFQATDLKNDVVVTSSRAKVAVQSTSTTAKGTKATLPALARPIDNPWLVNLRALPMSIQPPPPPTGLGAFATHITPTLRHLAELSPVATHYVPAEVSREVRPLERGYWTFDANRISLEQQVKFWQYLQRLIGSGNAGWGVWCTRERGDTNCTAAQSMPSTGLGIVKVFCWGEVAKHVYLLLYVASQSKVRKLGLQWIDSDGNVVVQMRKY